MTVTSNKITRNKAVIKYIVHSGVVGAGACSGAGGGSGDTGSGEDVCILNSAGVGVGMVNSGVSGS